MRIPVVAVAGLTGLSVLACQSGGTGDAPGLRAEPVIAVGDGAAVGFDEIAWAPRLQRLLVPAGETGKLHLVDPMTRAGDVVSGFSHSAALRGGHTQGATSAQEADGLVLAIDRTARAVAVVDPTAQAIVAVHTLSAIPDYVRYEPTSREVWVTEPDAELIEVFELRRETKNPPALVPIATIEVHGGPESLVFDQARGRAYANLWHGVTTAIDLRTHTTRGAFANGCEGSRTLALDAPRALLFSACTEGMVTTMDLSHGGQIASRLAYEAGIDGLAYDARTGVLYAPSAASGTMAAIAVGPQGDLSLLAQIETVKGAACAAVDGDGAVWVCDPAHGRVLRASPVVAVTSR